MLMHTRHGWEGSSAASGFEIGKREEMVTEMVRLVRSSMIPGLLASLMSVSSAHAGITQYTDRDAWFSAVGGEAAVTTIGFDDLGHAIVTDQYEHLGVIFDGDNGTVGPACTTYPQDCWGLRGQPDIIFDFVLSRDAVALHYPGDVQLDLYSDGVLIASPFFIGGPSGIDSFAGITAPFEFDRVVISNFALPAPANMDNLYFVTIPAPGALVLVGIVSLCGCRGRSRVQRKLSMSA